MVISEPAKANLGRNKARFNRDNKRVSGRITILVIDDDPEFRELTKTGLERENEAFEVIMESNPREVDSLLDQHAVDCLVTDYEMPHINGIELVKRVHDQYPALPVILYTGKGSEDIASRAISAGVTDYVKKAGTINEYELLANRISNAVEKRRQEQHAAGLRQRFEVVLETMDTAVFLKEPNGQYLLMNDACRELLGVNPEQDVTELTDEDLFPPERIDKYQADDRRVAETGKQIETEEMVPGTTGEQIRLTRKSPVYDQDGSVTAICGVSTDITEQKEREEEIRKLKKRLELAVEGANLGVWDWDMRTDEVQFNDNWATMLGYDPEEIGSHLEEWEQRYG